MQVKRSNTSETIVTVTVVANEEELSSLKEHVLTHAASGLKLPGFRPGKAPLSIVEKNVDQTTLQNQFLEEAVSQLYAKAIEELVLQPIDRPEVRLKKFVPFTELTFEADVPVIGTVTIGDYKKLKLTRPTVSVSEKEVESVLESLCLKAAKRLDVERAAQDGDQLWIDFKGVDSKGQAIQGAEGNNYPIILGSNTFIPGFEANLIGLRPGTKKEFTLVFPKDYGLQALANQEVTFSVTVTKVQDVVKAEINDAFAATVGPFKTLAALSADIKRQLTIEKQGQADQEFETSIIKDIASRSKVAIPAILIDRQIDRMEQDERQNLAYRGQTWQEHLDQEGLTAQQHREQKRSLAEENVKASLVLSKIAEEEKLRVDEQEITTRILALKNQYTDPAMQAELDKPEARGEISARILTEKTIQKLIQYSPTKK